MKTILTSTIVLLSLGMARGSVCLRDSRLTEFGGDVERREYIVPGYFYDKTLAKIFHHQGNHDGKATGQSPFRPLNDDARPDDDHDPENDGDGDSSGSFLALSLMFGLTITIVIARLLPMIPSPVVTLIIGMLFAVSIRLTANIRADGDHFLNLDSEYIIFGFTPVLIMGEILKLDVRLAKRMLLQFVFYGIVGCVLNTFLTTLILQFILPSSWKLELVLCLGALISTAESSFASEIMKRAGVPNRIIMLLNGEGMANDPSLFAILTLGKELYVRTHMLTSRSVPVNPLEATALTARIVVSAIALGVITGILTLGLVKFTSNRFEEEHRILQIVVTLIGCYATFFLAEGIFFMSGALAVVSCGWILAWKMWPKVISEQAMTAFWHTIDFISGGLLFLVVGFYMATEAFEVPLGKCVGYSFAIWAIALACRFCTLFLSWPVMNQLGPRLHAKELALWAWSSMKSRVGLALIIEFSIHLLEETNEELTKRETIFIIGFVFLISLVNGSTAGFVARLLKLDRAAELDDQVRSVLFKHAVHEALVKDAGLSPYLHHTMHFCLSDEDGKVSDDRPATHTVDWTKTTPAELTACIRSIFLSVLRGIYWDVNEAEKVSIRALQSLLTSTDHSLEEADKKPINDFHHLMVTLPLRDSANEQYRGIYTLALFMEGHGKARHWTEAEVLGPAVERKGDMSHKLEEAWSVIKKESQASEALAKQEFTARFSPEMIASFSTLRGLKLGPIDELIHHFHTRGLTTEKDSEESHEALIEDITAIKATMRSLGQPHETQDHEEEGLLGGSFADLAVDKAN